MPTQPTQNGAPSGYLSRSAWVGYNMTSSSTSEPLISWRSSHALSPSTTSNPELWKESPIEFAGTPRSPNQSESEPPLPPPRTNPGLSSDEAARRLAIVGPNKIEETVEPAWRLFARQFYGSMPFMLEASYPRPQPRPRPQPNPNPSHNSTCNSDNPHLPNSCRLPPSSPPSWVATPT